MTVAKIAVSMPDDVLRALDRAGVASGKSRSALVTEAVRRWLVLSVVDDRDRKYVEAYLREPEALDGLPGVASDMIETWERWT